MSLRTEQLDYDLPEHLIATRPAEPRDAARLMVVRLGRDEVEHRHVRDLTDYLGPRDLMVMNDTAVTPARLVGRRTDSGGRVEGLFLDVQGDGRWRLMLKSNGRLRDGLEVEFGTDDRRVAVVLDARDGAEWLVRPVSNRPADEQLDQAGLTPLPPYILRARGAGTTDDDQDRAWYQTVFADHDQRRSVAAPTAGLHFTPELLSSLADIGVDRAHVTLDVGPGTFKPVSTDRLDDHPMHEEHFRVTPETLTKLRAADDSTRIIAVGTTTIRTLESVPPEVIDDPNATGYAGSTRLMIAPGYAFRHVHGLMTNFHLPRSTLLALVGAMVGLERLLELYAEAVSRGYRFYSYGDAMLILPDR